MEAFDSPMGCSCVTHSVLRLKSVCSTSGDPGPALGQVVNPPVVAGSPGPGRWKMKSLFIRWHSLLAFMAI